MMHLRWSLAFLGVASLAVGASDPRAWVALPLVAFVGIPLADALLPRDESPAASPALARRLRALPVLFAPVHLVTLAACLWLRARRVDEGPGGDVAFVVAAGIAGGIAINVAHELMHRASRLEQGFAAALMGSTLYAHFCIEHVHGHHVRVATPEDPASARRGESLWAFLPRTLVGSFVSAWEIEVRRGRPVHRNRVALGIAAQAGLLVGIGVGLGVRGMVLHLGHAAVAVLLLETINYIEHYGLARAQRARPDGSVGWERVAPAHSWNAEHPLAGSLLLQLPRHADHHAYAGRSFAELRHHADAPELPGSYPAMMLLALVPPLWFRVMDPRADRARAGAELSGRPPAP